VTPWAPPDIHGPSTMFVERPTAPSLLRLPSPLPRIPSPLAFPRLLSFPPCLSRAARLRPACVFPFSRSSAPFHSALFSRPLPPPYRYVRATQIRTIGGRVKWNTGARSRVHVCVCARDNTKESLMEKDAGGGGGGGGSAGRKRWGVRGKDKEEQEEEWLVGEDDGGLRKGQEGPCCAVLHKSISRGCINTTQ